VTEDYSQIPQTGPSINRKGGVRLHPVRDGLIPLVREVARVRERDSGGNVYTEVTNPSTGFCMGVTSPLTIEGGPVLIPQPVVPEHNPVRDAGLLPQRDQRTGTWYLGTGTNRRVIRTVADGDKVLPSIPPRHGRVTREGGAPRGTHAARGTGTGTVRGASTRLPVALIDAYIQGLAERKAGRKLPPVRVTKDMRRYARLELARQKDIRDFCDESE
jgi:hypothetical protein